MKNKERMSHEKRNNETTKQRKKERKKERKQKRQEHGCHREMMSLFAA